MRPAMGLGVPNAQITAPGPFGGAPVGRPRVRVSPQEAGRPDLLGVRRVEGPPEVRALASRSVDPSVLARGAFKIHRGF